VRLWSRECHLDVSCEQGIRGACAKAQGNIISTVSSGKSASKCPPKYVLDGRSCAPLYAGSCPMRSGPATKDLRKRHLDLEPVLMQIFVKASSKVRFGRPFCRPADSQCPASRCTRGLCRTLQCRSGRSGPCLDSRAACPSFYESLRCILHPDACVACVKGPEKRHLNGAYRQKPLPASSKVRS